MCSTLAEDWNTFWTERLGDPFWRHEMQLGLNAVICPRLLEPLRARNVRRLLLAGNGCSLLPHAMTHVGLQVTVVDISSVANDSVAKVHPTPELLSHFLSVYRKQDMYNDPSWEPDPEASLQRVVRDAVPGGSLTLITADILDWEPEELFDAIYDDRLTMLLPQSDWPKIARKYYRWLNTEGLSIIGTVNLGGTIGQDVSAVRTPFEAAFKKAGFRETHLDKLPRGRLVCFWHGSG